jgi:hypothetical protein
MDDNEPSNAPSAAEKRRLDVECFIACGLIGLCLVLVIGWCAPSFVRMSRMKEQIRAMANGKTMVLALNDFASEYGSFPDRETAEAVKKNTLTTLDLDGDTANHYFRQLIAAGMAKSENPFNARTAYSRKRPDNNMRGDQALKPGEVGFGYIMNGTKALPADKLNRIIAVTPLHNGSATGEFDPNPLDGMAVLVYLDTSVKMLRIRKEDRQVMLGGKKLLENGPDTVWGSAITPVIKPPLGHQVQ